MTPEERQEIIAAVQVALGPFKEEIRDELIAPLRAEMRQANEELRAEMRQANEELRAEMRQANEELRAEMRQTNEELRAEMHQADNAILAELRQLREDLPNIILDTMKPFIVATMEEFRKIEARLDRLEKRVESLERRFAYLSDEVAELKDRVSRIEQALTAQGFKVVEKPADRWVARWELQRVEQRVTQLEAIVYTQTQ